MTSEVIKPDFKCDKKAPRPSRTEAEKAVEILLRWAGEDPSRPGLRETPARVVRAYEEYFAGYGQSADDELSRTFEDIRGFDDIVLVKDIDFVSHCEHHLAAIIGRAHVAYWPGEHVVGLSKLARVVDIFARRMISQENMTRAIVDALEKSLQPKGVAVLIEADHQCMSARGVAKAHSETVTMTMTGVFKHDASVRERFLKLAGKIVQRLLDPDIQAFIHANANEDVAKLGLKKPPDPLWPYPLVLDQIKSRQKAKTKLPSWPGIEGLIFPAPDLIEQASSEAAARYKATLVKGSVFADLTAGMGADFLAFLQNFNSGIAIEQDPRTKEILAHNLKILSAKSFEIISADAEDAIKSLPHCDMIYLDPQRRNNRGKGLFRLQDCSPNVLTLLPLLRKKADAIIIKTSPVLDIGQTLRDLEIVSEAHIVEWRGECREVLYVLKENAGEAMITPIIIDDSGTPLAKFSFTRKQEADAASQPSMPQKYLFEPSPAFQKSGCYKLLGAHYGLKKLHPHTHLYTSDNPCPGFPGRSFEIAGTYNAGGKDLPLDAANLTVRNFPAQTEALRKKLGLKDGGDEYIFACTLADESKALLHARKP